MRRLATRSCTALMLAPLMLSLPYTGPVADTSPGPTETRIAVATDVRYGTADGVRLLLDVYRPKRKGAHPAVVAVHGGSWRGGDKSHWRYSAPALSRAGLVVFSINYRLSPPGGNARFGDAVDDVARAVRWVRRNGRHYGADPRDVALLGSSAGAHLSLIVGQKGGSDRIRAVAAWSPPVDLTALASGRLRGMIHGFIGCSLHRCPRRYERMSPLRRVTGFDPPTFLASSTREVIPLKQVRAMAKRLDEVGVVNKHVVVPGTAHGQGLRELVLRKTIGFLRNPPA